jgi:hypothetical protein
VAESARGRRELSKRNSVRVVRKEKDNEEVWIEADRRGLSIDRSGRAESFHGGDTKVDEAIRVQGETIPAKRQLFQSFSRFHPSSSGFSRRADHKATKEGTQIIDGGRRDFTSSRRTEKARRIGGKRVRRRVKEMLSSTRRG